MDSDNGNVQTITMSDNKTALQALALINDCYKYIMDLTTNGVVITDAIKFVQTNKEKLTAMSSKEDNGSKESKEPEYDDDKDQLEEEQEEEAGEIDKERKQRIKFFELINRLSTAYQNIQLFIVNLDVFISLRQGKPKDSEIGIKDLTENIDKTSQYTPNMK